MDESSVHPTVRRLLQVAPTLSGQLSSRQLEAATILLDELVHPLSPEDITGLISLLPEDGNPATGLNWTILHAIEASPHWPIWELVTQTQNEWVRILLLRLKSGGVIPPAEWAK